MTDKVTKPRARKKREPKSTAVVPEDVSHQHARPLEVRTPKQEPDDEASPVQAVSAPDHELSLNSRTQSEVGDSVGAVRWQYKLPILYQPSKIQAEALDIAFISHFVDRNQGVRSFSPGIPWITHLPVLHTRATKLPLTLSIRAASMAFYAKVHQDPTIMVDSYKWYTMSLHSQRMSLSRLLVNSVPEDEEVLVPIILAMYEVYAGTTSTSVFQHLTAATKILEMRGPVNCGSGVSFPLFRAMRVSDSHKSMVYNHPSVFSTPDWMELPFQTQARNAHMCLVDILLVIPDRMRECELEGKMSSSFSKPIPPHVDLVSVRERTLQLLSDVDAWAKRYPHLTSTPNGPQYVTEDMGTILDDIGLPQNPSVIMLSEGFIALTAATYEAIRLILSMLLYKITSSPSSPADSTDSHQSTRSRLPSFVANSITFSKSVLDISAYIESTHPVGFDFMRSVFPLVVVAILGPLEEEQKAASRMLKRWGEMNGMKGLTAAWLHI
ncbi:hypothetical protein BDV95DRAFT_496472 [Massariosphaeria phaeospora]|uniref:Fungal-specific transcription factor domain-containing protein n=1 Tax=Massariosphaeria phaeospora TaxID=100035 RepID=A0A7C8I954_9PLEO|nr:hypothetical protein BDV95DRAFT_496472 [Massariosphaeria phaeospora]